MLYTVQDALAQCAEHVDGGLCASSPKVLARVNSAVSRLIESDDYNFTLDRVRFFTKNNSITLPREYVAARMLAMDGVPVPIDSLAYEYLESGPGVNRYEQLPKLIDEGTGYPVFFDIPVSGDWYLLAYSTERLADGITYVTRAPESRGTLTVNQWDGGVEGQGVSDPALSSVPVKTLASITLPGDRTGYITLYAYDPTTRQHYFLSKYHPSETVPGYRRYRLPRFDTTNGVSVQMLCKKRYIPATLPTDILLIQNLAAIKLMVLSIEQENKKDLNGAVAYQQLAVAQMQKQQSNENRGIRFNFSGFDDGVENLI